MFHMNNHIFSHTSVKFFGALLLNADFIPFVLLTNVLHTTCSTYGSFCVYCFLPGLELCGCFGLIKSVVLFCFFFLQSCSVLTNCKFVTFWHVRHVDLYHLVSEFSESMVSQASWAADLHDRNIFWYGHTIFPLLCQLPVLTLHAMGKGFS